MKKLLIYLLIIFVACNSPQKTKKSYSKILKSSFYSKELGRKVAYNVYLPESYDLKNNFKILYLLHGHGGSENDWINPNYGNIQKILDSLINCKSIPPIVAVTMDAGNSWYVDSKEKMESAYLNEFIPLVESNFKINSKLHSRYMAGNSAGGFGALRFGLLKPELFNSILLLSPAAYYPEPPLNSSSRKINVFKKDSVFNIKVWKSYTYPNLLENTGRKDYYPKFYISSGDDDEYGIVNVATDLRKFFIKNNIPQELTIINGKHVWNVWRYCFINNICRVFKDKIHNK